MAERSPTVENLVITSCIVKETPLPGVRQIKRHVVDDERGTFERLFDEPNMLPPSVGKSIKQVNRTITKRSGTVRGMHLQLKPACETKIVACISGQVFDVVVDLRSESPAFGRWWGTTLSGFSGWSIIIPPGCAHGLQVMKPDTQMLYMHDAPYSPDAEAGLNPLSAELKIEWPLPVTGISERDRLETRSIEFFRSQQW